MGPSSRAGPSTPPARPAAAAGWQAGLAGVPPPPPPAPPGAPPALPSLAAERHCARIVWLVMSTPGPGLVSPQNARIQAWQANVGCSGSSRRGRDG